jgi:excisionase family DNA binding protein
MTDSPLKWLLHKTRPTLQVGEPVFSLRQAGELLGLKPGQMRRLVKAKKLTAHRVGKFGHFKILQSEIERIRENK